MYHGENNDVLLEPQLHKDMCGALVALCFCTHRWSASCTMETTRHCSLHKSREEDCAATNASCAAAAAGTLWTSFVAAVLTGTPLQAHGCGMLPTWALQACP
jgi:hypothetical protein